MVDIKEDVIVHDYIQGKSVLALSIEYNSSTTKIQALLNKNEIDKISQLKKRNPDVVEDYFKQIDHKDKAYWIGWLLTDGGISNKNDIEIAILNKDEYILHQLENDLKIQNRVKQFGDKYVRFSLSSSNMCKDLIQYGIVPNKTLKLKFPQNIGEEYDSHLLRGMFDGDGGLTIGTATRYYKHRGKHYTKPYAELSFTGTYDMCDGFQKTLLRHIDIPEKKINMNHSIFRVRWSNKKEIIKICDFLYKDSENHYLKRKYLLYEKLKELVEV